MTSNVRATALKVLSAVAVGRGRRFAVELIDEVDGAAPLGARDRRFLMELTLGVLRHRRTLDTIIHAYSEIPLEDLDSRVRDTLRLAVYQLVFLDGIPPHAAVNESVKLVRRRPHHRAFVNGILRALIREMRKVDIGQDRGGTSPRRRLEVAGRRVCFFPRNVFSDPRRGLVRYLGEIHSQLDWLVGRWVERHGEEGARQLLAESNRRPRTYLRVNSTKATREEVAEALRGEGILVADGPGPGCLEVTGPLRALWCSGVMRRGSVSVQGAAAQRVAPALGPCPGDRILDVGAAPGTKTAHLAELACGRATILALDRDRGRLTLLADAARRLGLEGICPVVGDGTAAPFGDHRHFDRVLVDAPCSNTAVLSRRPEARWRLGDETLRELNAIQETLLRLGLRRLRDGGRLVYSTCSLEPEENGAVVARTVAGVPGATVRSEETAAPAPEMGDGGYFCVIETRGGSVR